MVDVVTAPARAGTGYVEWSAVFAGALAASAISFVLLTAGGTVGLSLISPYGSQSYARTAASLAVFWSIAVPILSLLAGGYIAGRMRSAWPDSLPHEVQFRDGVHGLLVWALSIVGAGFLAFLAAGVAAESSAQVAAGIASNESTAVAPSIDTMLATAAAPPPAGATTNSDARAVIARTVTAAAANGGLTPPQKRALAQIVSQRTGIPQPEAEQRVDQALKDATNAIETARQAAVLAGLVTATALLVGLLAAWYAAKAGGRHRDANVPARLVLGWAPGLHRNPLP